MAHIKSIPQFFYTFRQAREILSNIWHCLSNFRSISIFAMAEAKLTATEEVSTCCQWIREPHCAVRMVFVHSYYSTFAVCYHLPVKASFPPVSSADVCTQHTSLCSQWCCYGHHPGHDGRQKAALEALLESGASLTTLKLGETRYVFS